MEAGLFSGRMSWRHDRKRRFYSAWLERDLLGDWVLIRTWGSLDTRLGRGAQEVVPDYAAGVEALRRLDRRRRRRGYRRDHSGHLFRRPLLTDRK